MGAHLVVTSPAGSFGVPFDGPLTVGRAPDNAVRLDDIDVSRHHASIVPAPGGAVFTDLGSANGSRVGGRDVEPRAPVMVPFGETVSLGSCVLTLAGDGAALPPAQAPATGRAGTVVAAFQPAVTVATPAGSREYPLTGGTIRVGRSPDNEIQVDHDVVSRHHLVLRWQAGNLRAEDCGTTNGITLRGARVATCPVQDGDRLDIGGEVTLSFRLAPAAETAVTEQEIRVSPDRPTVIGRDPSCDVFVSHPTVSKHHARISTAGGQHFIEDLGSTNGTFVNGARLQSGVRVVLSPSDAIQVGPVRLHLTAAGTVLQADHSRDIRLTAVNLNQRINSRLNLLQDISVVVEPREFVAVVGVSGSGKSTLLGALSGLRPATDGDVLLNDTSLYEHFEAFRSSLGYVPQDDILHKELPVERALEYSAELRLPDDTRESEREQCIESVVTTLGLQERRATPIGRLSGGQRKRVSIGAELLTQPGLFFLDEATSGLDPGTENQLMRLLRRLADDGHTILLITHATKNVMLCDQVLFLAKGGNLAYFGPPDQALGYFGVTDFDGIYEKLEEQKSPQEWAALYRASQQHEEFVARRLAAQAAPQAAARPRSTERARTSSAVRQLKVLSVRYFDLIRRDRVNFALLFLLAPVLAAIDLVAWPDAVLDPVKGKGSRAMTMLFLAALIPFLVGSLSSVREIVKEAPIYARERAVSLKIWPYLGSKMAIGALFALYHAGILLAAKILIIDMPGVETADLVALYVTLVLAVVSGVMWALLISALTSHEEQAMMLVIGLIVLQVVFSGGLVPLADLGVAGTVLGGITSTAWSFKALTTGMGLSTQGCSGEFTACSIPGIPGLPNAGERALAYKAVDDQFRSVFNADLWYCWAAMLVIIFVLALALFVLQKRKDTL